MPEAWEARHPALSILDGPAILGKVFSEKHRIEVRKRYPCDPPREVRNGLVDDHAIFAVLYRRRLDRL